MQKEAPEYVRKCDQCQRFAPSIHQPSGVLNPLSSSWPFAQWGLDIVGPFPKAMGNKRHLLVSTDYFTKWVKTEPLANIRDADVKRFVWRNIVTRFGIPRVLSQTTGSNLTARPSGDTVVNWGSPTGIRPQLILRGTDRLKPPTRS